MAFLCSCPSDDLRNELTTRAATSSSDPDLGTLQNLLLSVIEPDGFIDYRQAYSYTSAIQRVIDSLRKVLDPSCADRMVGLAEVGLAALESAMQSIDDSDGFMNGLLDEFLELHFDACELARPDPIALAERLFRWEVRSGREMFSGAAATYAELLGEAGLARYRAPTRVPHLHRPVYRTLRLRARREGPPAALPSLRADRAPDGGHA